MPKKQNVITVAATGLTAYDIPGALRLADIAVVEEADMEDHREEEDREDWCKVIVKRSEVAEVLQRHYTKWEQNESRAKRFNAAAYFVVHSDQEKTLAMLTLALGNVKFVFD